LVALNEALEAHLARNWQEDLTPDWRAFFKVVAPDLDRLSDLEVLDIFPDRLNLGRPREAAEPTPNRHMTRAFDGLAPDQVRVVIIGQDPYPRRASATGRAFEDGAWDEANPTEVADSLRRILQSAAAYEYPDLRISEEGDDWGKVSEAIRKRTIAPPTAPTFFNALAAQGVLSVNAAWTFTGTDQKQKREHLRVWKPVMKALLQGLTWRDGSPIVFLLLGDDALRLFRTTVGRHFGRDAFNSATRLGTVYSDHPAYQRGGPYFACGNPLRRVNQALERLGSEPVQWWPLQQAAAEEPA
jgi:uracil-DNA glycosylase